jgi:inorganic pyrophosphatase
MELSRQGLTSALIFIALISAASCRPSGIAPSCPAPASPADRLPETARAKLAASIKAAAAHASHAWRDVPPVNSDGTVNVYVEIPRGSSEKWEFDMTLNRRVLDRMVPSALGGYPTGYGFVPGTIGVDGDPFDGLVIGPAPGGEVVRGHVLGFMHMTDEKGSDGKVVITPEEDPEVRRRLLNDAEKNRIASFFNRYKAEDADGNSFACVSGWGDEAEALRHVKAAARLVEEERAQR